MTPDYTSFQTDDFVTDAGFSSWVLQPTAETNAFWTAYLAENPQQRKSIERARVLVQALRVNWHPVTEDESRESYRRLEAKLFRQKTVPLWSRSAAWYRVAAAVALLVVALAGWMVARQPESTTYQTAYGKIRTVALPDQSVVTLNANSKLTVPAAWDRNENREVWLEGEAFFEVKHLNTNQKFLVHTADRLTVEVLGTSFNVFKRPSGTRVVLQSGKVKLNIANAREAGDVLMQPGELVEVEPEKGTWQRKTVNPEIASAWTSRKLIFDNTPLSEVVALLEETYGLEVEVSHPGLLNRRVFGSCPTDDLDIFLMAVSRPFGLSVKRDGKNVFISGP